MTMSFTSAPSTKKSSQNQEQTLRRHSARAAACPSSTTTEKEIVKPLSLDEQIVLVAIVKAYMGEFMSPDHHELVALQAAVLSEKMGVSKEIATAFITKIFKHYKNPFPGFF